jgi:uncharacterized protein (TIGR00730 family)
MKISRIGVFCGSSSGAQPEYVHAAKELGSLLSKRKIGLVFGGGRFGLMGEIAEAVNKSGGEVIGVIPKRFVEKGVQHQDLTELKVVNSMHERKQTISTLADAFIALPGGIGTIEEIFEVLTWAQLGFHRKPCGFLNVKQFYGKLLHFIDHIVAEEFLRPEHKKIIQVAETPERLLEKFEKYQPVHIPKYSEISNL